MSVLGDGKHDVNRVESESTAVKLHKVRQGLTHKDHFGHSSIKKVRQNETSDNSNRSVLDDFRHASVTHVCVQEDKAGTNWLKAVQSCAKFPLPNVFSDKCRNILLSRSSHDGKPDHVNCTGSKYIH